MITYEYDLDMTPGGVPATVRMSQYSQDIILKFNLYSRIGELNIETGTTAAIRGTKPDRNGISLECTLLDNVVTVETNVQMSAIAGKSVYEITLYHNDKELSTANFAIIVERAAMDKDTLRSESVLRELAAFENSEKLLEELEKYESLQEDIKKKIDKNQGVENAGKALMIDNEGNVIPSDAGIDDESFEVIKEEVSELKSALDDLQEKTFEFGFVSKDFNSSDVELKNGTVSNANTKSGYVGLITASSSNYDTYIFYTDRDINVYSEVNTNYFSIAYANNYHEIIISDRNTVYLGDNPTRYRKSENNLPTKENPLFIEKNSVVMISLNTGNIPILYVDGYTNIMNNDVILNDNQIKQVVEKKCVCKYSTSTPSSDNDYTSEKVDIFIHTYDGFIRYEFHHCVLTSINADNWRIRKAVSTNDNFEDIKDLTTKGEWECAVHLNGRDDFSGGYCHGDEVVSIIKFMIDGKCVDISTVTENCNVKELKVIESSSLYDPLDHTTVIANHGKEYIFTKDGLTINQSLKWLVSAELTDCYLAMFPVAKTVTNSMYTDVDFSPRLITYGYIDTCKKVVAYSELEKFNAEFSIPEYKHDLNFGNMLFVTDNSNNNYNKMYFIVHKATSGVTPHTTTKNELWKTTTKYKLDIGI